MRRKNDILWKGMIEEVFDDLLRFLFPDADQIFDMQRGFGYLDKELSEMYPEPDKASQTRLVDKLVKVFRKDGQEEWILVHIEVQGHTDKKFPERMFRYYCRIFDRYQRPITAIAIFTGQDGKNMPDRYEHCFLGVELLYRYNTLYITDYEDSMLLESNNPFARVVLTAKKALLTGKVPEIELAHQKLLIANSLYESGEFAKGKIGAILTFLNNYILFENQGMNRIFEEQLDTLTGKINTMGIFEQLAEIRSEEARIDERAKTREAEARKFVENLLLNTDFSLDKIASLTDVPVSFVEEVRNKMRAK